MLEVEPNIDAPDADDYSNVASIISPENSHVKPPCSWTSKTSDANTEAKDRVDPPAGKFLSFVIDL